MQKKKKGFRWHGREQSETHTPSSSWKTKMSPTEAASQLLLLLRWPHAFPDTDSSVPGSPSSSAISRLLLVN